MIVKEFGILSFKYLNKYPKHYAGYFIFGTSFFTLAYHVKYSKNEILKIGFAGSIAKLITDLIFHPIDVVNTRTKALIDHKDINSYKMIKRIFQKEGIFAFWRGASAAYYGAVFGGMIYFCTYKYLKNCLIQFENSNKNREHIHSFTYFTSSMIAEIPYFIAYCPFDLIKTRLQICSPKFKYEGMIDGTKNITDRKVRNFNRMYLGATHSFILNFSNTAILFTVLESLREYFIKSYRLASVNQLPSSIYFLCSFAAGAISGASTNIMEVITIHKQVDPKFKFVSFIREQGLKALTKGLIVRVYINSFHCIVFFYIIDRASKIFEIEL
jgi:hypothetical protein